MPRVFAKSWNQPPTASRVRYLDFAKTLRASNKRPAVLTQAASMTPTQVAYEDRYAPRGATA